MNLETLYKDGYAVGVKTACAAFNSTPTDFFKAAYCVDAVMEDMNMQKMLAKIASTVFGNAGPEFTAEKALYDVIQNIQEPLQEYTKQAFMYPVVESLANAGDMEKNANWLGILTNMLSGAPQLAAALSLGGGAALGSIGWALNRDSNTMEDETDAKLAQAEYYRNIARDLQKRIKAKEEGKKTTADLKEAVQEAGEGGVLL